MAASVEGRESLQDLEAVVARVMQRAGPVRLSGLRGAARAVVTAALARAHGERPVLVLVPSAKAADAFLDDLRAALGEPPEGGRVRGFPRHDTHPYERFSPQPFLVAQRMDVLYRWLASARAGAPQAGAGADRGRELERARACACPRALRCARARVHLEVGQTIDRDALVADARRSRLRAHADRRGARRARRARRHRSICFRRSARGRCASSCSATRSSRSASSTPRASARRQPLRRRRRRRRRARSCSTARS